MLTISTEATRNTLATLRAVSPAGCADELAAGSYTELAQYVDVAMACDDDARARYLAIWGVEWSPIYDRTTRSTGKRTATSESQTVPA